MTSSRILTLVTLLFSGFFVRAETFTEIPIEYGHGLIWLNVKLNKFDAPLSFLLDSGAQTSLLNLRSARRLGLQLGESEIVQGVESQIPARWVHDLHVRIGKLNYQASFLALDLQALSRMTRREIDGVLGMDFFRQRVVQIDFASSKVRLLKSYAGSPTSVLLPIKHHNEAMLVPVAVNGGNPGWTRLDTGSNEDLQWNFGMPDAAHAKRGMAVGLASQSIRHTKAHVQLGKLGIANCIVGIHSAPIFPGEAGLLGNKLLSRFTVTIDWNKSIVFLDPIR